MKIKVMVLSGIIGVVLVFMGYECSRAESGADKGNLRIGVVSIQKIFANCTRSAKYDQEITTERIRLDAELEKLTKEIEAEKAGLKTLKPGSNGYLTQLQKMLEKQAELEARREFYNQQRELKYQRWLEELYEDILRATAAVAKENGLDLVFEKDEVEFPALNVNNAMLAIRTHKLLYSAGCSDITSEVTARIDTEEIKGQKTKTTTP